MRSFQPLSHGVKIVRAQILALFSISDYFQHASARYNKKKRENFQIPRTKFETKIYNLRQRKMLSWWQAIWPNWIFMFGSTWLHNSVLLRWRREGLKRTQASHNSSGSRKAVAPSFFTAQPHVWPLNRLRNLPGASNKSSIAFYWFSCESPVAGITTRASNLVPDFAEANLAICIHQEHSFVTTDKCTRINYLVWKFPTDRNSMERAGRHCLSDLCVRLLKLMISIHASDKSNIKIIPWIMLFHNRMGRCVWFMCWLLSDTVHR